MFQVDSRNGIIFSVWNRGIASGLNEQWKRLFKNMLILSKKKESKLIMPKLITSKEMLKIFVFLGLMMKYK